MAKQTSVWNALDGFAFMEELGRGAEHPSRRHVLGWLQATYGQPPRPFSFLDCGVLSAVTYGDLRASGLSYDYTGTDVSAAVVADCRRRYPEGDWRQTSVTDLAVDDAAYDVVHCRHVLEHLPYYETAIRELARVTRRHLLICLFVPLSPRDEILRRMPTPDGYVWVNQYREQPFVDLLQRLFARVDRIDLSDEDEPNQLFVCER